MHAQVAWLVELRIKEDRHGDLRTLIAEMVLNAKVNEPGTLDYEWSVSPDGATCHLFERYADSSAALAHTKTFGERFATRFLDVLTPIRLTAYGHFSPEARAALAPQHPIFMEPAGGFSR
jgi:quinol monooxygenase YgiN